jgi:hypothetical protein
MSYSTPCSVCLKVYVGLHKRLSCIRDGPDGHLTQNSPVLIMSIPKLLSTRTRQFFRRPTILRRFAVSPSRPPGPPPTILPSDIPIEEETVPFYDPKYFLPVNPSDLLNNRYKILVKVRYGTTSTVWLAHDTQEYVLARLDTHSYVFTDGGV